MPTSTPELRKRFMTDECPDGISVCEDLVRQANGYVDNGFIYVDFEKVPPELAISLAEAVEFLICEWDYAFGE